MKIIRSKLNYTPDKGEKPKGQSLTVPDDSYTVKELIDRYEAGLGFGFGRPGMFDLEDDTDDNFDAIDMNQYQNLDITDKEIMHEQVKEVKADAERKVKAYEKRKKEEASKAESQTS